MPWMTPASRSASMRSKSGLITYSAAALAAEFARLREAASLAP
jgi:hypothetical protein